MIDKSTATIPTSGADDRLLGERETRSRATALDERIFAQDPENHTVQLADPTASCHRTIIVSNSRFTALNYYNK